MKKQIRTRRNFLKTTGLGIAASAITPLIASSLGNSEEDKNPPSFVIIFTDDQTYRAIGYNNSFVSTPALDQLAEEGVIFDYTYVASPICVASRSSILTGLFPQQHESVALDRGGFKKNVVNTRKYKTIAHFLSEDGYTTAFCGKSHLREPKDYGFVTGKEHSDDEAAFAFAHKFLNEYSESKKPFLLWIAPHQPHLPLLPDQKWLDLYKDVDLKVEPNFRESPPDKSFFNQGLPGESYYRDSKHTGNYKNLPAGPPRTEEIIIEFTKAYYATISHLDHQVGNLITLLKSLEMYDNTVIIFLSDNGYFLGNHGLGNKITMHEESVRVPMFIHWNKLPNKGIRCSELVSSLDILPTVLDLAQIDKPNYLSGKSLVPLFSNPSKSLRKYVASECVGVGGSKEQGHRMVRTKEWKYILSGRNEEALFNELDDRYELKNLAESSKKEEVLSQMRQYMNDWMDRVGDTHVHPPQD